MFSPAVWCMFALIEFAVVSTASNVYLLKGCSLSFPSIPIKLYLISIGEVGSRLYIRKNGENFVEVCLLTLCANKTPSIILGQWQRFQSRTFTNNLMVLFCRSQSPFYWGWYAKGMRCSVPIILCKILLVSLTNFLSWSLIWIFLHTCRHITS